MTVEAAAHTSRVPLPCPAQPDQSSVKKSPMRRTTKKRASAAGAEQRLIALGIELPAPPEPDHGNASTTVDATKK
jgi:hypothetical protein